MYLKCSKQESSNSLTIECGKRSMDLGVTAGSHEPVAQDSPALGWSFPFPGSQPTRDVKGNGQ